MKKILIYLFLSFFLCSNLSAKINITDIKITGNDRINNQTIEEIIGFEKNKFYQTKDINDFQKKLFETNFFEKIIVKINETSLAIEVKENPLVDFFYIEGVKNKDREDQIYNQLSLGQNKIFSEQILKKDLEKIYDIYRNAGYLNVNVEPKISKQDKNLINLVLKIDRGENIKIDRIYFIGDKYFSSSTLDDVISSSEHGWWKLLSNSSTVNQNRINFDIRLLKNFYLDRGFYDVQITSSDIVLNESGFSNIIFSINAGKKYKFGNFKIKDDFNVLDNESSDFINSIFTEGINNKFFSIKLINKIKNTVDEFIKSKKIEFIDLNIIENKNSFSETIDLALVINKTKVSYVNTISITGNSITEEEVIRRALNFVEGDTYSEMKKSQSLRNINRTGIFKKVEINKKNTLDNQLVDVNIAVDEQPTGAISAGLGVGTTGANVSTGIQEKNLFGKGISTDATINAGTEKISGNVFFDIPDFRNSGNNLGYNLFAISTDYENAGYESKAIGNSISTKYDLFEDVALRGGVGFDIDSIDTSDTASALYKSREGDYLTTKLFYNISSDLRDSFINPTTGHRLSFGQTLATPPSDITYIQNDIFGSIYHQLSKDFIINLKGGGASINSLNDDVKLSDRKFLTSRQLRGFENYGVGPIDNTDHIGGNYTLYSSVSSTIPNGLPDKWNANSLIFLDAGNVWGVDFDDSKDSNKIRSSIGIGIDWISPLGPLSFTLSEVISKASTDTAESFTFQIGSAF